MDRADAAERYLRVLAERALGAPGDSGGVGPAAVRHAADALTAAGALPRPVAARVVADLALAEELRRPSPDPAALAAAVTAPLPDEPAATREPLAGRAVAVGPVRLPTADGILRVDVVTFGPDGTSVVGSPEVGPTGPALPGPGTRATARRSMTGTGPLPALHPVRLPPPARSPRPPRARVWDDAAGAGAVTASGGAGRRPGGPTERDQPVITDDLGRRYRLRRPSGGERGGDDAGEVRPTLDPVPPDGTAWLEVAVAGSAAHRLPVTAPTRVAGGRAHGRSPAASWLLGALHRAVADRIGHAGSVTGPESDGIADGAAALRAIDALADDEPLLRQAALLADGGTAPEDLDAQLGSPLAGAARPPGDRVAGWAIATVVDLEDRSARLDALLLDERGLRLCGAFAPWSEAGDATTGWLISAFDDRHNQYVAWAEPAAPGPGPAEVAWHLLPALDPAARRLRLNVAGPRLEASVEVVVEAPDAGRGGS